MARQFTEKERQILAIVQDNLPDSLTPYADIAKICQVTEAEVLDLLNSLKDTGAIRRFGASIRHQRTGWNHNAMVAWLATEEEAEICGAMLADNPHVSHSYFRPTSAEDWPYTFYTMVHGRSARECQQVVETLAQSWPLKEYAILRSIRELKKTSMTYFA